MVANRTAAKKTAPTGPTDAPAGAEAGTETLPESGPREATAGKTAGRTAGKKTAKKTAARKTAARKSTTKSTTGKRPASAEHADAGHGSPAGKAPAKKATAGRSTATKASKEAAHAATVAAESAEQTGAHTVVAKKSAARTRTVDVPPASGIATAVPGELAVRPGEDPWTPDEVAEARAALSSEVMRLRSEMEAASAALAGLMRDSGDGAGDDDADTGTKNITREHEMSLAANAQEMLEQTERALARLDAGTYGLCEVCGKPIGKARMQAFPRATLCVEDKQKQERRG
ncbi:TraR/DksA C4-type zinc finger protein [Streptomyces sp. ML-6]|uniref:TraR/DksA family transcriptional regulator n=1 Tax=Streptomyces sp. ML-6 TaxID=2982693 RepID=UPI0024BFFF00|nr:TraR/DksA C4-type zinc finger protein [Streptomyces sp. ML-6]MDK0518980.1 TraR/DksA C4-type zinc finger protein [Streptomyces sp. ML-6]